MGKSPLYPTHHPFPRLIGGRSEGATNPVCSDTLLDFGLDLEKLDKWQDLASAKGGKKAKKSRKTI